MQVPGTDPYPWPYDGNIDGTTLALVVCGAQEGLVARSVNATAVAQRLDEAAHTVRRTGGQVLWVRHGGRDDPSRPTGSLPVRGRPDWGLADICAIQPDDTVIDTAGWDGCYGSDLDHTLRRRGIKAIVLGGFASEIAVDSTVRTLNDRGHECLVLVDACAPIDAALGKHAHASLTMSGGIFGALGTVESFVDACEFLDQHSSDTTEPCQPTHSHIVR